MVQMWKEIQEQPVALENCLKRNTPIIKELVKVLKEQNIDNVIIAARGTSDHAAVYGKYVIEMLKGIPVSLAASSIFTVYKSKLSFKNCLVIGISQSGKAEDVLEVLRSANASGAITVGITNNAESPVATETKYFLSCEAGLETSVAATKTFTTQMLILASLAAEWTGNQKIKDGLSQLPSKISKVYELSDQIESKVERYRFMNECFVLARGINYAISLETALKIQETTYVRAKAFATSDFQHGPIAMLDKGIPVIVFAPEGPSLNDVSSMIDRIKSENIETIVVSNVPSVLEKGNCSFKIPDVSDDIFSPFYNVIVAQMFACKLALAKGLNPDNPRGLKKVTITK